jgi:hypothetical protein
VQHGGIICDRGGHDAQRRAGRDHRVERGGDLVGRQRRLGGHDRRHGRTAATPPTFLR